MKKSKKNEGGALALVIMVIGFAIGFVFGRGLEFYDRDEDFDDDDFELDLFSD